ncbi:MAG: bifunctional salicylyl-CoA 5-hydroxylase/oxidoreductase [Haliea sp.]
MKIVCLGGGPSGLYLAICMKLHNPSHEVAVYERNRPDDTFGWGVVFSDQTVDNLLQTDPVSGQRMVDEFIHWDMIDCHFKGEVQRSDGHGFIGLGRKRMLQMLHERCDELGVELHFETEFSPEDVDTRFADADVIVASDGLNSKIRNSDLETFDCNIDVRSNKFVWLGTKQTFRDAFTFIFEETEHGWIWAHAYQFDQDTSTFIVECNPDVYDAFGFEHMSHEESAETCRRIFADYLDGHELLTNSAHIRGSAWINFPAVLCRNWVKDDRIVLIGDAAHTAHFSIGSGTKLGLEDAISLAQHLNSGAPVPAALRAYQEEREIDALRLQNSARNAMVWFENVPRYARALDPMQFNYSMLTRSQRVSHENLRLRDKAWLESMEKHLARQVLGEQCDEAIPPMFLPWKLRDMSLINRVVVSPMSMYSAVDGLPDDWHLVHYGSLAKGGAGLVYTEMTDVSPEGRITPGCAGIWNDEQEAAWTRIVNFVHQHSQARFALQLGHAGPKGATKEPWKWDPAILDEPLPKEEQWPLLSASALPYDSYSPVPAAINRQQMDEVRDQFVEATRRGARAGFDMLELHAAHGYLISAFITPVLNKREDEYGGSLENRLRYPLEVFRAMREAWPADKPMSVRISAHDWMGEDGNTEDDAVAIASAFRDAGADIIDVSSGQVSHAAKPLPGRMFQTPLSDRIRNEGGMATMAVGNIYELDHVNSIIAAGRADLVCLARPHLADPNWTLRAAAELGYRGIGVSEPHQYFLGFRQLHTNLQRAQEMAAPL